VVEPRYYRYGGKRYAHLVDEQIKALSRETPATLRLRPRGILDREGAGHELDFPFERVLPMQSSDCVPGENEDEDTGKGSRPREKNTDRKAKA